MVSKNKILCIFFFSFFLSGVSFAQVDGWYTEGNFEPKKRIKLTIVNTLNIERLNCPVTIKRMDLPFTNIQERWVTIVDPTLKSNPEPTAEQLKQMSGYLMRKETFGHFLEYQQDDIDKDGIWDELFFMTDLKPKESKTIYLYIDNSERGLYPHKTHAGMGYYGRHPVPFWESENIGWKLWYFSDVDLHGKRTPMLTGYIEYSKNLSGYYMPWEYGTDIMTVANTFGAGGICLFETPAYPDSMSRPRFSPYTGKGPYLDTRYAYDVVFNGPLRSMIKVKTMNWNSGIGEYELEQYYTAYANKSWCTCKVVFTKFYPGEPSTSFGCGIRRIMNEEDSFHQGGIAISNGKNVQIRIPDEDIGDKGLSVDFEGIAVVVKDIYRPQYMNVNGFGGNHVFKIPATPDNSYEYMLAAGWSEGSLNKTKDEFRKYVSTEALLYNTPIELKLGQIEIKK